MVKANKSVVQLSQVLNLPDAHWVPMHDGGHLNRVCRGRGELEAYVRVRKGAMFIPGREIEREQQILMSVRGCEWAPELLASDTARGLFLYPYYPGRKATAADRDVLLRFLDDLRQHDDAPPQDYASLIAAYRSLLPDTQRIAVCLSELEARLFWLQQDSQCLVHHDLHPDNLLSSSASAEGGCLKVLDWEYAGRGNPWLDRAALAESGLLRAEDLLELTPLVSQTLEQIRDNLRQASRVRFLLNQLWSWRVAMIS